MSQLKVERIAAAYAGLDLSSAPDKIAEGYAPVHENFLLHYEGKMVMRGGLYNWLPGTTVYSFAFGAPGANCMIAGVASVGNTALVGSWNSGSATATKTYKTVWLRAATATNQIATVNTWYGYGQYSGATPNTAIRNAASAQNIPVGRGTSLGTRTFALNHGVSSATTYTAPQNTYAPATSSGLLMFDANSLSVSDPTLVTAVPWAGQQGVFITSYLNRLWVLGDNNARSSLYYSDVGGITIGLPVIADWQDNTTGLTNKIVVGEDTIHDFGVGLGRLRNSMVIFKRNSIFELTGYNSATFAVNEVSRTIGCVDSNSIVETDEGVFFQSLNGYMFYDGQSITNVSEAIQPELLSIVDVTVGANGTDGSYCVASDIGNNYIMLCIGKQSFTSSSATVGTYGTERQCYMYHIPTGRWTHFYSNALKNGTFLWVERLNDFAIGFDGENVYKLDRLTQPINTSRGLDYNQRTATNNIIPAKWWTKLYELATPAYRSQFHRILMNYLWLISGAADDTTTGYSVSWFTGNNATIQASYSLPSMGTSGTYQYRRMHVQDCFTEATDAYAKIEYTGATTGTLSDDAIYDGYIEYQVANQRRSS